MSIVEARCLRAPLPGRRAVTTCRSTVVLLDSVDDSQNVHSLQEFEVQARRGGRRCIRIDGIRRSNIIPSPRSKVRWLAVLDSGCRYVELNVIFDPSVSVGWPDFCGSAGCRCISTHRSVTGYYSQSHWSWCVHVLSYSAQKLSWSSRPDSCRCIEALHRYSTSNTPKKTHESSDSRTVSMTTSPTVLDHANVEVIFQTRCPPFPSPPCNRFQVSHSTAHLPRNFAASG